MKTVCDVEAGRLAEGIKQVEGAQGNAPGGEVEMRRLFDDQDIDAVVVATPEHWHALATVRACQAGKDVYVEKNISLSIWEGRKMIRGGAEV